MEEKNTQNKTENKSENKKQVESKNNKNTQNNKQKNVNTDDKYTAKARDTKKDILDIINGLNFKDYDDQRALGAILSFAKTVKRNDNAYNVKTVVTSNSIAANITKELIVADGIFNSFDRKEDFLKNKLTPDNIEEQYVLIDALKDDNREFTIAYVNAFSKLETINDSMLEKGYGHIWDVEAFKKFKNKQNKTEPKEEVDKADEKAEPKVAAKKTVAKK